MPLARSETYALKLGHYPTKNIVAWPWNQAGRCWPCRGYPAVPLFFFFAISLLWHYFYFRLVYPAIRATHPLRRFHFFFRSVKKALLRSAGQRWNISLWILRILVRFGVARYVVRPVVLSSTPKEGFLLRNEKKKRNLVTSAGVRCTDMRSPCFALILIFACYPALPLIFCAYPAVSLFLLSLILPCCAFIFFFAYPAVPVIFLRLPCCALILLFPYFYFRLTHPAVPLIIIIFFCACPAVPF